MKYVPHDDQIGNHFEVYGYYGLQDRDTDEPDFSSNDEWDDDFDYFEDVVYDRQRQALLR